MKKRGKEGKKEVPSREEIAKKRNSLLCVRRLRGGDVRREMHMHKEPSPARGHLSSSLLRSEQGKGREEGVLPAFQKEGKIT